MYTGQQHPSRDAGLPAYPRGCPKNKSYTMSGHTNLDMLISTMQPELHAGEYVFCGVPDLSAIRTQDICCFFREEEEITLIVEKGVADRLGLSYGFRAAWITLRVHSSLEAVGLTAAFSTALTAAGISCNVVAGLHHDHLFVPVREADRAIIVLRNLSASFS